MFEWDEEEGRWNAAHHPFTSVHDEDLEKLTADPARCAPSLRPVLNGVEMGSGSIPYPPPRRATQVFAALACRRRGPPAFRAFLLDALEYRRAAARWNRPGAGPPGDDSGRGDSIRDVIPSQDGARLRPHVRRPSAVPERQLRELGISLRGHAK